MQINKIALATLANGALEELFENELDKIIENINDPNTSIKKARKIAIELKFLPIDDNRDLIGVEINTKTTLAPTEGTSTKMIIGEEGDKLIACEYGNNNQIIGQMGIDSETGKIIEDNAFSKNIVDFKAE